MSKDRLKQLSEAFQEVPEEERWAVHMTLLTRISDSLTQLAMVIAILGILHLFFSK